MAFENVMGNPEFYKMFYAGEQTAEAQAFQRETGWHMIWGSDYQGLNGDTWVVYREIADLPKYLQNYAREMAPEPTRYYYPELDLDGTADELFVQARNGYIEEPEALAKVQEILSNAVEKKYDKAFYIGVLKEIAEDDGQKSYVFAQMKKDILDGVNPEEVQRPDGLVIEVRRERDEVLIALHDYERDAVGAASVSVEKFLFMSAKEFEEEIHAIYYFDLIEQEDYHSGTDSGNKRAKAKEMLVDMFDELFGNEGADARNLQGDMREQQERVVDIIADATARVEAKLGQGKELEFEMQK